MVPSTPAPRPARLPAEVLAFVLSLIWIALVVAAIVALGARGMVLSDTLGVIVVALAVFLPLALIWLAALVLRAARQMRDEAMSLHVTVQAMRDGWLRDQQAAGVALKPTVEEKLDAIAQAQQQTEAQIAAFVSRRAPELPQRPAPIRQAGVAEATIESSQPGLGLDLRDPAPAPLTPDEIIRALHFPESESDEAGFAALRRALADHGTGTLVRAAQAVLTTLAQEGIYMDDLRPDQARPEIWRAFAAGTRGRAVAALGGVRDRSCLALTVARMRADPAFREAAHRFLRAFDLTFARFEIEASDADIARLSQTRSARAFMLLGRVTGMFG